MHSLWELSGAEIVTSVFAAEEARRNLSTVEQRHRLEEFLARTRIVEEADVSVLPASVLLPEKDKPILAAAIGCGATHLITGDRAHFGVWFGETIGNLTVLPPATYLESRKTQEPG